MKTLEVRRIARKANVQNNRVDLMCCSVKRIARLLNMQPLAYVYAMHTLCEHENDGAANLTRIPNKRHGIV